MQILYLPLCAIAFFCLLDMPNHCEPACMTDYLCILSQLIVFVCLFACLLVFMSYCFATNVGELKMFINLHHQHHNYCHYFKAVLWKTVLCRDQDETFYISAYLLASFIVISVYNGITYQVESIFIRRRLLRSTYIPLRELQQRL